MPGRNKIKSSGSDFGQNFSPKKKDFVGLGKPSKKKDFVGLGKPNTKKVKQKDDKSDFSGGNKFTPKVTKSIVSKKTDGNKSKPKVITPAMIKAKGFTTLRDYLNNEKGLKRKDGKKVVKTSKTSSSMPKPPPKAPRGKNKIVPSLKTSSAGIDGGSSQVNKAKKKIVKKNPMSTKTPKTFKGTNITPTKLQRDRMRKRAMGST